MSLPLHLKYRPRTLNEVVGQPAVVEALRRILSSGDNMPRAFLFAGTSGTGKTTLARILARELGTSKEGLLEIDAATNSGIDAMRIVLRNVDYRALGDSPIKFVILDECQQMSSAAWSVLLKPIEEPPSHAYWALCTTEGDKVPETIESRCVRCLLRPVATPVLVQHLTMIAKRERMDVDARMLELCAAEAHGNVRTAIVNLEMIATR